MRGRIAVVATVHLALLVSGCGWTATDVPLPGGGLSGDTYELDAEFKDVLNLPDKAKVTMGGIEIGQVESIEAEGYTAIVSIQILERFQLPRVARLELRQATPLGEVFVAVIVRPGAEGRPILHDGDTIPLSRTGSAPSVEDTLAALSTLINGGGLANLNTIIDELNTALDGRAGTARQVIRELTRTAATVNARSREIQRVLTSIDDLARTTLDHQDTIDDLLSTTRPAVRELADQTDLLVTMLRRFGSLTRRSSAVLGAVRDDGARMLQQLDPVLNGFLAINHQLGPSMRKMLAFHRAMKLITEGSHAAGQARLRGVLTP